MVSADTNTFRLLAESLNGKRQVDEKTFSAIEILAERLARLKNQSSLFAQISFSPAVEELAQTAAGAAI
ncbi:MAG: hypothetical protein NTX52_05660 [Planctomycetota bacterium]|nr:hypothetical protein [Planctomycetota bacterium]